MVGGVFVQILIIDVGHGVSHLFDLVVSGLFTMKSAGMLQILGRCLSGANRVFSGHFKASVGE